MKVHHIGYLVKDVEKAFRRFSALGFVCEQDTILDEQRGINIMFILKDDVRVELIAPANNHSVVTDLLKKYRNTAYHICYTSGCFEEDMKHIENDGGIMIDPPCPAVALGGKKVAFFMFPEIGIIEIVEE